MTANKATARHTLRAIMVEAGVWRRLPKNVGFEQVRLTETWWIERP